MSDRGLRSADPAGELPPLERVIGRAPLGLALIDPDHRLAMVNPAIAELLGYPVEGLTGVPVVELVKPSERELATAQLEQLLSGEVDALRQDYTYVRSDGEMVCARIFTATVRDDDGQVVGVVAQVEDITAELEAAAAQAQLSALVEALGEAVITTDGSGVITSWNPAAESLLGWTSEEVVGRSVGMILPERREGETAGLLEWLATGKTARMETERLHRDGSVIPVRVVISPVMGADGSIQAAMGILHDISEQAETHRRLAHLAGHDPVTGLPNRRQVGERLEQAINAADADGALTAVLFVDLDDFKPVNDRYGHHVGDEFLRLVGARLRGALRPGDVLGRWGGDEYVAVLAEAGTPDDVRSVAQRLLESLAGPLRIGDLRLPVSASIGAVWCTGGRSAAELLQDADGAMYRAKAAGGGRVEDGGYAGEPAVPA